VVTRAQLTTVSVECSVNAVRASLEANFRSKNEHQNLFKGPAPDTANLNAPVLNVYSNELTETDGVLLCLIKPILGNRQNPFFFCRKQEIQKTNIKTGHER